MQEVDQYQVFELIQQDTNKYTENRNGVFVNLSHLDDATLQKLATFVQYWTIQREAIAKTEAESKSLAAQFGGTNPDDEAGGVAVGGTAASAHAEGHRAGEQARRRRQDGNTGASRTPPAPPTPSPPTPSASASRPRRRPSSPTN